MAATPDDRTQRSTPTITIGTPAVYWFAGRGTPVRFMGWTRLDEVRIAWPDGQLDVVPPERVRLVMA